MEDRAGTFAAMPLPQIPRPNHVLNAIHVTADYRATDGVLVTSTSTYRLLLLDRGFVVERLGHDHAGGERWTTDDVDSTMHRLMCDVVMRHQILGGPPPTGPWPRRLNIAISMTGEMLESHSLLFPIYELKV